MSGNKAAGASHIGQRSHNEDAWFEDDEAGLILVADGVGGHQAGEVASALACEVVAREVLQGAGLAQSIHSANAEVMSALEREAGSQSMATTIVAARLQGPDYELAWVGDSRAYVWDGRLKLLTRDHSHVQELFDQGQLSIEQARDHPKKNVILQALGMQSESALNIGSNRGRLAFGELLLLCSDGLSDVLDSAGLCSILSSFDDEMEGHDLQSTVDALVNAAVNAGGRDNITAVLVAGEEGGPAAPGEQADCVWSFDPRSGEYSGLPQPAVSTRSPILTTEGGPIAPRSTDDTVLMSPPPAETGAAEASADASPDAAPGVSTAHVHFRGRRLVLLVLLGAVIVLGLFYSLSLAGAG